MREIARGSFDLVLPLCSLSKIEIETDLGWDRGVEKKKMVEMKRKKEKRGEGERKKKGKRNEIEFPSEKYRHRP